MQAGRSLYYFRNEGLVLMIALLVLTYDCPFSPATCIVLQYMWMHYIAGGIAALQHHLLKFLKLQFGNIYYQVVFSFTTIYSIYYGGNLF